MLMHGNKCVYIYQKKAFKRQNFSANAFYWIDAGNSNVQIPGKEGQ